MPIELTHLVGDVMRRWPATIRIFIDHGMHCIGCPIAGFHTVDEACREHGVGHICFVGRLRAVATLASADASAGATTDREIR